MSRHRKLLNFPMIIINIIIRVCISLMARKSSCFWVILCASHLLWCKFCDPSLFVGLFWLAVSIVYCRVFTASIVSHGRRTV